MKYFIEIPKSIALPHIFDAGGNSLCGKYSIILFEKNGVNSSEEIDDDSVCKNCLRKLETIETTLKECKKFSQLIEEQNNG